MGLLKRIFSIGTKKNKKKHALSNSDNPSQFGAKRLDHIQEEEQEAAASRLLRSSSSRYAVVSEFDYASYPALPHPINNIIQTPAVSSASLSNVAVTQRGTYTVTVHRRTQHALTEFPNANPSRSDDLMTPHDPSRYRSKSMPVNPRDSNCLQGLRQDPSVASLLNMYDEHGRLPPSAFSNTPPSPAKNMPPSPAKEGRAQTHRNGSTLRQLLGNPASRSQRNVDNSAMEGDISWAERYLGETDSMASMSSLALLETPTDLDTHFPDARYPHGHFHTQTPCDLSNNTSASSAVSNSNYPAISSLEVEVSMIADSPPIPSSVYQNVNPVSPQRASQVFGFLTEKRISIFADEMKGSIIGLHQLNTDVFTSHFSDCSSESVSTQNSEGPSMHPLDAQSSVRSNSPPQLRRAQSQSYSPTNPSSPAHDTSHRSVYSQRCNSLSQDIVHDPPKAHVRVIITAPTPSNDTQPARIPRGPRQQTNHTISATESYVMNLPQHTETTDYEFPPTSHAGSSSTQPRVPFNALVAPSKDPFTPIPPRRGKSSRRTMSHASRSSTSSLKFPPSCHPRPVSDIFDAFIDKEGCLTNGKPAYNGKENNTTSAMFVTPVRSKSLFGFSGRPSPASSTELSPVGRQLMMNLRQQRTSAREAERQKRSLRLGGAGFRNAS